jgi:hypothetical protein
MAVERNCEAVKIPPFISKPKFISPTFIWKKKEIFYFHKDFFFSKMKHKTWYFYIKINHYSLPDENSVKFYCKHVHILQYILTIYCAVSVKPVFTVATTVATVTPLNNVSNLRDNERKFTCFCDTVAMVIMLRNSQAHNFHYWEPITSFRS